MRSGGHHSAALALTDGGLTIDLSGLREVHVDPAAGTARGGGGVRNGEWLAAAGRHGLSAVTGTTPDVGSGLLLGGGIGYFTSTDGLGCDRIVAADLVTAEGELRHVDGRSDPELLWALRGAGAV